MTYSDKKMKTLILELAETAEPQEAEALRSVAQNYKDAEEQEREPFELRFRTIITIAAVVYLFWTPLYFLIGREPIEPPPSGRKVEQLGNFTKEDDGRYRAQIYMFAPGEIFVDGVRQRTYSEDPVPLVVYEGRNPLPKGSYEIEPLRPENVWRFVRIKADPTKSGKPYYVVLP